MSNNRRLFLDSGDIYNMKNLIRQFHQAVKFPDNPVLTPDLPWERAIGHNHGTVLYEGGGDSTDALFLPWKISVQSAVTFTQ